MRLASVLFLAMIASCGGDDDGGDGGGGDGGGGGGDRGPIAIADLSGSCADTDCDGAAPSGNCYCDDDCSFYADCCDDYLMACSDGAPTCGGFAGNQCERPTFCHYAAADVCGTGDQVGVCTRVPDDCVDEVVTVCGCDGTTYDNACLAAMAGTSVAADGECR